MNALREQLKAARTAMDIKRIALQCGGDKDDFSILVKCMEDKDRRVSAMAAWAMSHAVIRQPGLLHRPHHIAFIGLVRKTNSSALKRNIMRAWQSAELPEDLRLDMAEIALSFLQAPGEDVAIKAFSITVLQKILPHIPELKEEILFILEKEMPHATAAYVVRARQFIKASMVL